MLGIEPQIIYMKPLIIRVSHLTSRYISFMLFLVDTPFLKWLLRYRDTSWEVRNQFMTRNRVFKSCKRASKQFRLLLIQKDESWKGCTKWFYTSISVKQKVEWMEKKSFELNHRMLTKHRSQEELLKMNDLSIYNWIWSIIFRTSKIQ